MRENEAKKKTFQGNGKQKVVSFFLPRREE
jgi:hypothetical protein